MKFHPASSDGEPPWRSHLPPWIGSERRAGSALAIGGTLLLASMIVPVALSDDVVRAGLVGVVVIGYLALANSDADSQLLTVTATVTHDVLPVLGVEHGQRERLWADRITVLAVGTIAFSIAVLRPALVALLSGLGTMFAILGVVVIATLYWDRTTDRAAFGGLAVGLVSAPAVVVTMRSFQVAPVAAVLSTGATVVVVSLLTGRVNSLKIPSIN